MGDNWRLLKFHKDVPEAHERVKELIPRIYTFIEALDSGADPNILVQHFLTHFTADLPRLFALGIIHDDRLVGHLLIQFEEYYGCTNMTVLQYQIDEATPRAFHKEAFEELVKIGHFARANNMVAVCPDEKVERLHKIFHGMQRYATLMTLDLAELRRGKLKEVSNG
jgi:hypothetical protein